MTCRERNSKSRTVWSERTLLKWDNNRIFEAAVQAYSRAWCRSFARQMMRHIPAREIRDIIYTQIVEDLDYKEVMASKEEFWRPSPRTLPSWRRTLPRVITRAFMGTQFAMAISQTIYETACFWIRDSEDLKDLLLQGPLEPDLVAPFDFIRRLNVVINLTHFLNPPRASRQVRVHKDVEAISDQRIRNIHECSRMKHVKCLKLDLEVQTDVPDCNTTFDEAVL